MEANFETYLPQNKITIPRIVGGVLRALRLVKSVMQGASRCTYADSGYFGST